MFKCLLILGAVLAAGSNIGDAQATVNVEPSHLQGPRLFQDQTQKAVVRDYLFAWQSLSGALNQNRADLLDADFVGAAKTKLAETIQQQAGLGIHVVYQDRSHDIQVVFYSPEGLSVQLTDKVEYDVQVFDHDKVVNTKHVSARYIAVMTPAEVRWRVRVFQAESE